MFSDYSQKEAYWYRRRAVEAFYTAVLPLVPQFEERTSRLRELGKKIQDRNETWRFKCVYLFREGQKLDPDDDGSGGGFSDTWQRADHFNLGVLDEETDIPWPGQPLTVRLAPRDGVPGVCSEFTECWHPACQQVQAEKSTLAGYEVRATKVIYLLCREHARDENLLRQLHDLCVMGVPVSNPETTAMILHVRDTLIHRIDHSLTYALKVAEEMWATTPKPDTVLEVNCKSNMNPDDTDEEATYYIDLVSVKKRILDLTTWDGESDSSDYS
jgi:hypothetical protein